MATSLRRIKPVSIETRRKTLSVKGKSNESHRSTYAVHIKMASQDSTRARTGREKSPAQSARVKRFHSKSRKGCITCRMRRVKCDERREPMCSRCARGGYVCEWQDYTVPMLHPSASTSDDALPTRSRSASVIHSPPFVDDDGGRTSSSRIGNTAKKILVHFIDMIHAFASNKAASRIRTSTESELYFHVMMQASTESIAIQKILAALGTLHDWIETGTNAPSQNPNFIKYYSEAVTDVRQLSHSLSPEVILITCVLFAICEYLMGYIVSGAQHLRSGASILAEQMQSSSSPISSDIIQILEPVLHAFTPQGTSIQPAQVISTQDFDLFSLAASEGFRDLAAANNALRQLCFDLCLLMEVSRGHPVQSIPAAAELRNWATLWLDRCDTLNTTISSSHRPWLQLLKVHHQMLDNLLQLRQSSDVYDNLEPHEYDKILLRIAAFRENVPEFADARLVTAQPLSSHLGLIAPLLFITMHCGNLNVARAALSFLKRLKVVEGHWNSCIAYSIALFVVDTRRKCQQISTSNSGESILPPVEVRGIALNETGDRLQVQIKIFGDRRIENQSKLFSDTLEAVCPCQPDDRWTIERIVQLRGYQGFVTPTRLEGCNCHEE